MSDLSRLLGNVYRTPQADAATAGDAPEDEIWAPEQLERLTDEPAELDAPPTLEDELAGLGADAADGPEWADEQALDEAFADWAPGPPASAPSPEHDALSHVAADREALEDLVAELDDDAWTDEDELATTGLTTWVDEEPTDVTTAVDEWSGIQWADDDVEADEAVSFDDSTAGDLQFDAWSTDEEETGWPFDDTPTAPAVEEVVAPSAWRRTDDDLVPRSRRRRRGR